VHLFDLGILHDLREIEHFSSIWALPNIVVFAIFAGVLLLGTDALFYTSFLLFCNMHIIL